MSEKNVANFIVMPFAAPAVEGTILELRTDGVGNQVQMKAESDLDNSSVITGKVQESVDGVTFTDVAGAVFSVNPGGAAILAVTVAKYVRFLAVGSGQRGVLTLATDQKTQHITQLP